MIDFLVLQIPLSTVSSNKDFFTCILIVLLCRAINGQHSLNRKLQTWSNIHVLIVETCDNVLKKKHDEEPG